ncbi:MAG: DUF3168 domain-containing protein [Proteobacteria bacterium]|nr:DUF3168 domain-containing protein [Pseudomonadota bacterium]
MSAFGNAILKEVYTALVGNPTLLALVQGVFDHVPQDISYPYVAIGELVETEFNDDDAPAGVTASLTVHCYSRKRGRKETHDIQAEIQTALHRATLAASGFNFVSIDHEQSQSFTDADGITRHGIVEFKIIMTEA